MEQIANITIEKELRFSSKRNKPKNAEKTIFPPRGYVTLEQFAEDTKKIINDYYDRYDIH